MSTSMGSEAAWQAYLAADYTWFPYRSGIVSIVLVTVAYGLRFWARRVPKIPWGWDDWLMIPAYLVVLGTCITGIMSANIGSGRHIEYVILSSPSALDNWGEMNMYITTFFYGLAVTLPKLALLVMYLRIFTGRFSKWICWVTMFVLCARVVSDWITIPLQCGSHPEYAWQPDMWAGNCDDIVNHYRLLRLTNILTDVVCLFLPLPTVWKLQLDLYVKLGVLAPFLLGSFGLVAAVITMVAFVEDDIISDGTWFSGNLVAWTIIEPSVYFISVCLVTYRPLLTKVVKFCGAKSSQWRSSQWRSRSPTSRDADLSEQEKGYGPSWFPRLASQTSHEDRLPEPHSPVSPVSPLDWDVPIPVVSNKSLPPSPPNPPLPAINRSLHPPSPPDLSPPAAPSLPPQGHRPEPDGCGECYDCLAVDISRKMSKARSVDLKG